MNVCSAFIDARELASGFSLQIDTRKVELEDEDQQSLRSKGRKNIGLACTCHAQKLDLTSPARIKLSLVLYVK